MVVDVEEVVAESKLGRAFQARFVPFPTLRTSFIDKFSRGTPPVFLMPIL